MAQTLNSNPGEDGFRMPGEFESHFGCWMLWPERGDNWRLGAKPAQTVFAEVATLISRYESLTVGVSHRQFANARSQLPQRVRLVEMSSDDCWVRDCGPSFVVNDQREVRGIDWGFNAWGGLEGGLYFPWDRDEMVAQKILEMENLKRYALTDFVLEGGSIHVDGQGTLITTEQCLLNSNRNPDMTRSDIATTLKNYLGIEKIIWLKEGLYGDETNGHVDNLCCFARPGEVLLAWTADKDDPQHQISRENLQILESTRDARGRKLKIHKIGLPGPLFRKDGEVQGLDSSRGSPPRRAGQRLAGSYINFLICNGAIVLPVFDDPRDEQAIEKISSIFPTRDILPVQSKELLLGGGNIHCLTLQQPAPDPGRSTGRDSL